MSKADKMRDRLAMIQKDREDFEKQKKELEEEMHKGRQNMGKIKKGLRNNDIATEQILVSESVTETDTPNQSRKPSRVKPIGKLSEIGTSSSTLGNAERVPLPSPFSPDKGPSLISSILPSGPRVSDWCFTGDMNSAPPIVKSREMYENVRLLGRGSFGEVNLVKNLEDNKLFAIKTIFCAKDADMGPVLHEVKFLRLSRHPCIIDIHDCFLMTNPRVMHIVMHYCESGSIASFISTAKKNKSSIAESQIIKWTLQLALALQFMHDINHTLHRDIKPMNVMLTEGGEIIKLADFGLALNMDECTVQETYAEAGTPYYTAPEMIKGENYTYPADCWSFGIILYQLLTLERPFDGASTSALVKAILTEEPAPISVHYSEDIRALSAGLLLKDPSERVTMAQLLSDPFMHSKASAFPSSYRPRTIEERIRRSHVKTLEHQMDALPRSHKSIVHSIKVGLKLTPIPATPVQEADANSSPVVAELQPVAALETNFTKIEDHHHNGKSISKVADDILDKISDAGDSRRGRNMGQQKSFASVSDDEANSSSGWGSPSGKLGSPSGKLGSPSAKLGSPSAKLPSPSAKEALGSTKMLSVMNPDADGEAVDLHGPIGFLSSNVIKMRSNSYHGHVLSDEERDAMVTPYMTKHPSINPGEDEDFTEGSISPMKIDAVMQHTNLFANMSGKSDNRYSVNSHEVGETPSSLESPNVQSSPMPVSSSKPPLFHMGGSDRSITSDRSHASDRSHSSDESPAQLSGFGNHGVSMQSIQEEDPLASTQSSQQMTLAAVEEVMKEVEAVEVSETRTGGESCKEEDGVDLKSFWPANSIVNAAPMESSEAPDLKRFWPGQNGDDERADSTLSVDINGSTKVESENSPVPTAAGGRKGQAIAKAIEADTYYESKLNE